MNHKERSRRMKNPHDEVGLLNKLSFWYLRDLYKTGLSRPLTENDVFETSQTYESKQIGEKFSQLWKDELTQKNPSVLRMFYRAYGPRFLSLSSLFSIIDLVIRYAQPLFLGALLAHFADPQFHQPTAYLYAAGIVLCSLLCLLFHVFIQMVCETAMKTRIGASRLVYDKVKLHDSSHLTCSLEQ
jgi:ATP-binding cassette, subfamily C (CFTR/MRP), member 4